MAGIRMALWLAGLSAVRVTAPAGAASAPRLLFSFEQKQEWRQMTPRGVRLAAVTTGATEGARALRIEFARETWPHVAWSAGDPPWDWRGYALLVVDVTNPGDAAVAFALRVDDDPAADGVRHCRQAGATIAAGASGSFGINLGGGADPMAFGMRGLPRPGNIRDMGGRGTLRLEQIVAFQLFLPRPAAPATLLVDNIRLLPAPSLDGIVDAYGQYTGANWPGKVQSDADLARLRAAEEVAIARQPALPGRDEYGGWADGPTLPATGFFRAEKHAGRWWLVTPAGKLFLSFGMNCVRPEAPTFVESRERLFTWLPGENEPLARFFGRAGNVHSGPVKSGRTFDFFLANLQRKYGADSFAPWGEMTMKRLRHWGFNTIANWSDPRLFTKRMPYTTTLSVGGNHARLASGSDYWGKMHDPFDPQFAADADAAFRERATALKEDPFCLGYFVDNELSWGGWGDEGWRYGLARGALVAAADSPAKAAFIARLKARYETVERLNTAWGTAFNTWDALAGRPFEPPLPLNAAMKADMGDFVRALALQYFTVVRDTLRRYDPNHLYLGCRFAWRTPEAVQAAAEVCDVVSFNLYRPRLEPNEWEFARALDRPCLIGEFHFGALDRGLFHTGLVAAPNQEARARMYREYIQSVVDHPAFVGAHWFQYKDEPLTGRTLDGENYNIGFVTVTDTPYPELVAAARAAHAEAYARRFDPPPREGSRE